MFHDHIKVQVSMNLFVPIEGPHSIPHTPHGSRCSLVIQKGLEKVKGVTRYTYIETVMSCRIDLCQTTMLADAYLDLVSGRLHDCVLPKCAKLVLGIIAVEKLSIIKFRRIRRPQAVIRSSRTEDPRLLQVQRLQNSLAQCFP